MFGYNTNHCCMAAMCIFIMPCFTLWYLHQPSFQTVEMTVVMVAFLSYKFWYWQAKKTRLLLLLKIFTTLVVKLTSKLTRELELLRKLLDVPVILLQRSIWILDSHWSCDLWQDLLCVKILLWTVEQERTLLNGDDTCSVACCCYCFCIHWWHWAKFREWRSCSVTTSGRLERIRSALQGEHSSQTVIVFYCHYSSKFSDQNVVRSKRLNVGWGDSWSVSGRTVRRIWQHFARKRSNTRRKQLTEADFTM